jgi:hypothetical protein
MSSARAIPLTGSDQAVQTHAGIYRGYVLRETSGGAPATVLVYDSASGASGTLIDAVRVPAGDAASQWYGGDGIWAVEGLYVDLVSGAIAGSVRLG